MGLMLVFILLVTLAGGLDVTMQTHDNPFICEVDDGVPPYIYVWQSSIDGDFGYYGNFTYDKLSQGQHLITVKVSDAETDTQIPAFEVIKNSAQSIKSEISVDMLDPNDCVNPRIIDDDTYYYGDPINPGIDYRCGDGLQPKDIADTCFYRLFDKDTAWTKIFAVTPMLEDKTWAWDWNWSRTTPPDRPGEGVNVTIFIGGGCKRTSAFLFNYTEDVISFYVDPINDSINVTIYDGMNPPVIYTPIQWHNVTPGTNCSSFCKDMRHEVVCIPCPDGSGWTANIYCIDSTVPASICFHTQDSDCTAPLMLTDTCDPMSFTEQHCACLNPAVVGRNLLPFPPADSIADDDGTILHMHPFEGVRYSYFAIEHTIPENASYLDIRVNYTCETELQRNISQCGPPYPFDIIKDKSIVYDSFLVGFLEHENPKDNCRWSSPLEWRPILGDWVREWIPDPMIDKHVLRLNWFTLNNRRMVSIEPVQDTVDEDKIIEMRVKGDKNLAGDIAADTTIGFYSDENADEYWFLDLHADYNGNLEIGKCDAGGCDSMMEANPAVATNNNVWYRVKIYLERKDDCCQDPCTLPVTSLDSFAECTAHGCDWRPNVQGCCDAGLAGCGWPVGDYACSIEAFAGNKFAGEACTCGACGCFWCCCPPIACIPGSCYIIHAKVWPDGSGEPPGWQVEYVMVPPGETPFGTYMVIGTEGGTHNETFWFDPEPDCGINVTGYYDTELLPFGYTIVTEGFVDIRIQPDILSGINLAVGDLTRADYTHVLHPAKHRLYRKEKAVPAPMYPDTYEFYYEDKYGYESITYGFDKMCRMPLCTADCYCKEGNIFSPECTDVAGGTSIKYYPDDCICLYDECYPDPCTSTRTYHEYEGTYYDFVDFYNKFPPREERYFRVEKDETADYWISAGDLAYAVDLNKVNSPQGTYQFHFSGNNLRWTDFNPEGKITIHTHLRNYTYRLIDVLNPRNPSEINYTVTPSPDDIVEGDTVTIEPELTCGGGPKTFAKVRVEVTNYDDELMDVSRDEDGAYVTTDAAGKASFRFKIREDTAQVTLRYEGDNWCKDTEVIFILSSGSVRSLMTSFEFILLFIIFILAIFSYRWFKKGRLDFYEMWQEFRGEKD
jgi:hypothetical protein